MAASLMISLAGAMLVAAPGAADARLGGGGSFGSRGSRTYSMPAPTATAPRVSPFNGMASRPGFGAPGMSRPGFFGGGFGRGLLGGFLGAGLFGMLFGGGFGGGLGGGMSIIGLMLQLALLYFGFRFVMGFFRRQSAAGGTGFGGAALGLGGTGMGGAGFGGSGASGSGLSGAGRQQGVPITIAPEDYQAFERRLIESQAAYSDGDVGTLRRIATPEMAGTFEQELAGNARQGVVNKLSNVRLLSGDLSEAWREGGDEYATVAMKFSLIDATREERTGRVVAGNPDTPQNVTEVWTFVRRPGAGAAGWALSAIQQT